MSNIFEKLINGELSLGNSLNKKCPEYKQAIAAAALCEQKLLATLNNE